MNKNQNVQSVEEKIREAQEALKALRAEKKELNAKEKKPLKGVKVEFTNKAGEKITGMGVLYYVTRMNGKLHYKEASQVTVIE